MVAVNSPEQVFKKPFAEWPSHLRAAFLEGWAVESVGFGRSMREVMAGKPDVEGVLLGAAWGLGKLEALDAKKVAS